MNYIVLFSLISNITITFLSILNLLTKCQNTCYGRNNTCDNTNFCPNNRRLRPFLISCVINIFCTGISFGVFVISFFVK